MNAVANRINTVILILILCALLSLIGMVATNVRGGPLDPPGPVDSTMKSLDDIPGSWSRVLPANDGLPGPDPKAGCDSSRFECLEDFYNAAVLDRETGLVWYIEAGGVAVNWSTAQHACLNFPVGTTNDERRGWRLPTYEEIQTLARSAGAAPKLAFGHPFTLATDDYYWTATSVSATAARAWNSATGGPASINGEPKTDENYYWCVRGGEGYDGL